MTDPPCTCPSIETVVAAALEGHDRHLCALHDGAEIDARRIEANVAEAERCAQLTDAAVDRMTPAPPAPAELPLEMVVAEHLAGTGSHVALNDDEALAAIVGAPLHRNR